MLSAIRAKQLKIPLKLYLGNKKQSDAIVTDKEILKQTSLPTTLKEIKKIRLYDRLKNSVLTAWTKGVGMAAIQIGIPLQAAWYSFEGKERLIFNPRIIKSGGIYYFPGEGCLSVPNKSYTTKRFLTLKVENGDGEIIEAEKTEAVILQHEIDHMMGRLCDTRSVSKEEAKIGRNEPCPCGSGKKFKKCCGV